MKITAVDTICLSRPHERERQWFTGGSRVIKADCAIVVISTDEGLQGIGEACAYGYPLQIKGWVEWYAHTLIGHEVTDPTIVPHPHGHSWSHDCAVAGIDTALWDLRGKSAGKPVSALLTTRQPLDKVRLYASSGCRYDWGNRPETLIEEVLGYLADGYTACKVRIGTDWRWDGVAVDRFLGLMRDLAQVVDRRMDLMLDGNQRLTEEQALPIAKELDRLGFAWFEEPIPQFDVEGYARINAAVDLPITGGEQFTTAAQFRYHLERRAYDKIQPDMAWCGLTEGLKIAALAERYGVQVCPHSWHNGLMAMANGHFVAALSNPFVLELCMVQGPLQWGIMVNPPEISEGWLILPSEPGLGVTLAPHLEEIFPYIEGEYFITVHRTDMIMQR